MGECIDGCDGFVDWIVVGEVEGGVCWCGCIYVGDWLDFVVGDMV